MTHPELLGKAIKALGVNRPVLAYKVVGDRIQLWVLGDNKPLEYVASEELQEQPLYLSGMSKKELLEQAADLDISGRSKMTKAQLVKALTEAQA